MIEILILFFFYGVGLNTHVLQACCGEGGKYNFDPLKPCGLGKMVSCTNPEQYFNWDGIHLTDVV